MSSVNLQGMMASMKRRLLTLFSSIPIIGGLHETSRDDHLEASRELLISLLISTSPLWGGSLALSWPAQSSLSFWAALKTIVSNGELFIYAASTLAPIIYIVTRDRDTPRAFPSKFTYVGSVIVFAIVATIIFTMQRLKVQALTETAIFISMWFFLGSIFLFYIALVYHNTLLPDPAGKFRKEEQSFADSLHDHRK
jgi:hypothetical protein